MVKVNREEAEKKELEYQELDKNSVCAKALKNGFCLGCMQLENKDFLGVEKCSYLPASGYELAKQIVEGIQTSIEENRKIRRK